MTQDGIDGSALKASFGDGRRWSVLTGSSDEKRVNERLNDCRDGAADVEVAWA